MSSGWGDRDFWNIGSDGIINVIDLLEEHGIKVIEIDAPESFDGLSSMVNDLYPVIVLNKAFSSERKRFTALHELGHLGWERSDAFMYQINAMFHFVCEATVTEPL